MNVKEAFGRYYADRFGLKLETLKNVLPAGEAAVLKHMPNNHQTRVLVSKIWRYFKIQNPEARDWEMRFRYRGPRDASVRGPYNAQSYALKSEGKEFSVYLYKKTNHFARQVERVPEAKPEVSDEFQKGYEAGLEKADVLLLELLLNETDYKKSAGIYSGMNAIREQQNIETAKKYK